MRYRDRWNTYPLVALCVIIYLVSVAAAWWVPPRDTTIESTAATAPARPSLPGGVRGVGINFYHVGNVSFVLDAIDRIADLGFNGVQIVTPLFQENGASGTVNLIEGDGRGPRRADLLAVMRHAKQRGLVVSLMPQINLTDPRGNEWRGKIEPLDWPAWWASYNTAITAFATLAAEAHADVFIVGCELLTSLRPEHDAAWHRVIASCRAVFPGALTYSCTWDTYGRVTFWDRLDLIGISGYWDLTAGAADRDAPTDAELATRWRGIRADLEAFGNAKQLPILITEVGYPSLPWALADPWNYVPEGDTPADVAAQARGYRSFIAAWTDAFSGRTEGARAPFAGMFLYEWGLFTDGGPTDRGYTFRGKPAEAAVREWLNR